MKPVYYDSSIAFYCSGCIGYRWAVKMTQLLARNEVFGVTDTLCLEEILHRFAGQGERDAAETVFRCFRKLMHKTVPVTVEDFDRSTQLYQRHPDVSPRALLRAAVMKQHAVNEICATFASGLERVDGIERVNLMEKVRD